MSEQKELVPLQLLPKGVLKFTIPSMTDIKVLKEWERVTIKAMNEWDKSQPYLALHVFTSEDIAQSNFNMSVTRNLRDAIYTIFKGVKPAPKVALLLAVSKRQMFALGIAKTMLKIMKATTAIFVISAELPTEERQKEYLLKEAEAIAWLLA